jgi:hypothetical protein
MAIPTFEEYLKSLSRITAHVDPTASTSAAQAIRDAAFQLENLPVIDLPSLVTWVTEHPSSVPVLGLTVGLSQEKLRNVLRQQLGSTSWLKIAREDPLGAVSMLNDQFDLLNSLERQRNQSYSFGDILVARAGTRVTAASASISGRSVEDRIEAIANELGLRYETRTRFEGRSNRSAPCDLAVPSGGSQADIVVAAKAFDSTGSKLTDAVREVEEMADVRRPTQFVMAVIDGIGWLSRANDLRRIHTLWISGHIDGMYTLSNFNSFRLDLKSFSRLKRLLP